MQKTESKPNGIYFLKIQSGNSIESKKFIVRH
ncbi:MAG: T9SS type A sorting domain-containing protein [Mariniphaga sp.]|nr:T9SS type A sorting domain-containing protein [Mariniphaga sp.]